MLWQSFEETIAICCVQNVKSWVNKQMVVAGVFLNFLCKCKYSSGYLGIRYVYSWLRVEGEGIKTFKMNLPTQETLLKHDIYRPLKHDPFLPDHLCSLGLISLHIQMIKGHSFRWNSLQLTKTLDLTKYSMEAFLKMETPFLNGSVWYFRFRMKLLWD